MENTVLPVLSDESGADFILAVICFHFIQVGLVEHS